MNESQRLAYLDAMGVTSYFPRAVLPGALASPICLTPVSTEVDLPALAGKEAADTAISNTVSAAKGMMASLGFLPSSKIEKTLRSSEPEAGINSNSTQQLAPHFSLLLVVGETVTLLVKAVDETNSQDYQQMLKNILFALGDQSLAAIYPFNWPMINSAAVDQSLPVARQALVSYLKPYVSQRDLIAFGDVGQYFSLAKVEKSGFQRIEALACEGLVVACAVQAYFNPLLKRDIWHDLKPLRQPLNHKS